MGKYLKGMASEGTPLGTLAASTMVTELFDEGVEEPTKVSSLVGTWGIDDLEHDEGPITFGVAHSDYDLAEIEAVLENTGSWSAGDKIAQEISRRLVRIIGTIGGKAVAGEKGDYELNEGRPFKTKLNWWLQGGEALQLWAYNSGGAQLTTGATVRFVGHANLWRK